MGTPRLAIIIPALNEAETIGSVVESVRSFGLPIVVDDGSVDKTADVAKRNGADVVVHSINTGYDAALSSGFKRAAELRCVYAITMDADGQHDPTLIRKYLGLLDEGCDLVIGVRDRVQRISEAIFGWTTNRLFGLKDPLCGMKGYKLSLYLERGHFDSYDSVGTELAIYAIKRGCRFSQVPISTRPRKGTPRFGQLVSGNYRILRSLALSFFFAR